LGREAVFAAGSADRQALGARDLAVPGDPVWQPGVAFRGDAGCGAGWFGVNPNCPKQFNFSTLSRQV